MNVLPDRAGLLPHVIIRLIALMKNIHTRECRVFHCTESDKTVAFLCPGVASSLGIGSMTLFHRVDTTEDLQRRVALTVY